MTQRKKTSKKISTPKSDPDRWRTTEEALTMGLSEEMEKAWLALRQFAVTLGEQRIYASGKAIVFAKKACYFFVLEHADQIEGEFAKALAEAYQAEFATRQHR